jgi:hypothetical protein
MVLALVLPFFAFVALAFTAGKAADYVIRRCLAQAPPPTAVERRAEIAFAEAVAGGDFDGAESQLRGVFGPDGTVSC